MEQDVKSGWARYVGITPEDKKVIHGEMYPCLITLGERYIILPEKYGDHHFVPGVSFEIVDPFLININKVLK